MATARAAAVRWVSDEPQPGWVEVILTDASGRKHSIFDKPPLFDAANRVRPDSAYPIEVDLQCDVEADAGGEVVVRLLHGLESSTGRFRFTLRAETVTTE